MSEVFDVIIIGAGPAGIGMGITLEDFGIKNYQILEKGKIGESFRHWPKETRFITPSFTTNGFGMTDLNAVSITTSPAYTFEKEHLSGEEYAEYLELLADYHHLPIKEGQEVVSITKNGDDYLVKTNETSYSSHYLILALGEFAFYDKDSIEGTWENSIHYAEVQSWTDFSGDDYLIIGGNESSMDVAINLVSQGARVTLLTKSTGLNSDIADPSIALSPYTRNKVRTLLSNPEYQEQIQIKEGISIAAIEKKEEGYIAIDENGNQYHSKYKPILGIGFNVGALSMGAPFFELNEKGDVLLNHFDESTITENIFMVGPSVKHQHVIFCYIYKFRQRFAVIAEEIAQREGYSVDEQINYYRNNAFYLEDCENCDVLCDC